MIRSSSIFISKASPGSKPVLSSIFSEKTIPLDADLSDYVEVIADQAFFASHEPLDEEVSP